MPRLTPRAWLAYRDLFATAARALQRAGTNPAIARREAHTLARVLYTPQAP